MEKEGLFNRLAKKSVPYLAVGAMLFSSCDKNPVGPGPGNGDDNGNGDDIYTPTAVLEVEPNEGYAPLEVRLQCYGEHPQGVENIERYVLKNGLEGEIESESPIDITESFESPGKYNSECTVYSNGENNSKLEEISVYDPGRPRVSLDVDPSEGVLPLNVEFSLEGEHPEGFGIAKYFLNVGDNDYLRKSPIHLDTTFSNPGEINFTGWVEDERGNRSTEESGYISVREPSEPSVSHSANLEDLVNIEYNATLDNIDEAVLKVSRNGNVLKEKTITGSFSKTYEGMKKGGYEFSLDWKHDYWGKGSSKRGLAVPNYNPVLDSSGLNFEFDEEGKLIVSVEGRLSDPNPEDEPFVSDAWSVNGNVDVSIKDNYKLKVVGKEDKYGDSQIGLEISDGHDGIATATIPGYIYPLARVSGTVKNVEDENLAGEKSKIKIYDENWNPIETKTENDNGLIVTDSQGNFSAKLNRKASDLELLVIQAAHGTPNNRLGYVRTETIPGDLANPESPNYNPNIEMMAVPFYPYINNPEEFQQFFKQFGLPNKFDFDGRYLAPLNHSDLQGFNGLERIRILSKDPCTDSEFTQEQQENIKDNVLDPNDINAIVGNYEIKEDIIVLGNGPGDDYNVNCDANDFSLSVLAKPGVLLYAPRNSRHIEGRTGRAIRSQLAGIGYSGTILGVPGGSDALWSHETGHIFLTSPHPTALGNNESVMVEDRGGFDTTLRADHKAGRIMYYEFKFDDEKWSHFILMDGSFPQWEMPTENILGLESGPENKTIHKNGKYWHGK